jgi:hypothetical protein
MHEQHRPKRAAVFTNNPGVKFQEGSLLNSPFDRAFFRGVDLGQLCRAIEKTFHIVHQKSLGLGIGEIQTIVIDDARLGLQPFSPTWLANFRGDFLAEFGWQRRVPERGPLLPATRAPN